MASILTDSLETPELDTCLDKLDAITSSVSSGFQQSVSTLSDNPKLQLVPSIRSCKLWCKAGTLLAPVSLATKMLASKLIFYFSGHPTAFRFWSLAPLDNITWLLLMGRLISLSQVCGWVLVLLIMPLLTQSNSSPTSELPFLILFPLPDSEGGIIPVSKVCDLLLKVHDILDKAVSKWVGNSAHILAHVFNSVSRQHCEVWASQFPFLHSPREVIPPSEACL